MLRTRGRGRGAVGPEGAAPAEAGAGLRRSAPIALPRRARGVALVVALLVVALATILVAALLDRGELALARTRNALRAEQVQAYAQGLEVYAIEALMAPREGPDTRLSRWAQPLPLQEVPGGTISATLRDLNGCFNLNNLAPGQATQWRELFARLLAALELDPRLGDAIAQWLDPEAGSGPQAAAYLGGAVPYRAHGGLFAHVSELRLVRGVDAATYARLAAHVCVLPPGSRLNANTASAVVLQALAGSGSTPATAALGQRLWQNGQAQWADAQSFWRATPLGAAPPGLAALVDVHSDAFLARGDIVLDDLPFTVFSVLLQRGGRVIAVQRSRGADEALLAPVVLDPRRN